MVAAEGPPDHTWLWSEAHGAAGRVVQVDRLWGETVYTLWLPSLNQVARVPARQLRALDAVARASPAELSYLASAARAADALGRTGAMAPVDASVIPLPHQIQALRRAISLDDMRYLLADEVGLGKTVEAGLVLRELKLRGLVKRTLVVAPKGLVTQWVAEMQTHFGEEFHLLIPSEVLQAQPAPPETNIWRAHGQVVCPMDSVKPLEARHGWSQAQVDAYNRVRFDDLVDGGWDLIIVDEAHRLGGSTEHVARYRLGLGLSQASPYLLLLSATPHQGNSDAFHRLMALLAERTFPHVESVNRESVRPYVIRTEKRRAVSAEGRPLFKPRHTQLIAVPWDRHREQAALYEAVTEYVREGFNQALREKKSHIGFLMTLMQRLVSSSTQAIRSTLERRLEVLREPEEQLSFIPTLSEEEWEDLDAQEQMEMMLRLRSAFRTEAREIESLLTLAERAEARGPDAKAEALLEWIYRLQREEANPELKVLIFTEFVATQRMLAQYLTDRGFTTVCLNGSMDLGSRRIVQRQFAGEARVLVSTDAGGEGLNLQFCHLVVNFDMPWNPMRLEQRIGRVDRIGQVHTVRALNLMLQASVEYRVREVLEQKLAVILHDLGIDKTGDVLDSAQAGRMFDDVFTESILHPEEMETWVDRAVEKVRAEAQTALGANDLLGSDEPDPAAAREVLHHPLPGWVERMTVSYLRSHGGEAERHDGVWRLVWPGGKSEEVVFSAEDAAQYPAAQRLTLEDERVRRLVEGLTQVPGGAPIAVIRISGLPEGVRRLWSLWRITASSLNWEQRRFVALFVQEDGRVFLPTAQFIWDALVRGDVEVTDSLDGREAGAMREKVADAIHRHGEGVYGELHVAHGERLERERQKGERAFAMRRQALSRMAPAAGRYRRLAHLSLENVQWQKDIERSADVLPELYPVLLLQVNDSG